MGKQTYVCTKDLVMQGSSTLAFIKGKEYEDDGKKRVLKHKVFRNEQGENHTITSDFLSIHFKLK